HGRRPQPAGTCLALHLLHILLFFRGRRRRCVEAPALKSAARRAGAEEEARGSGLAGRPEARGRQWADPQPAAAGPAPPPPPAGLLGATAGAGGA
uniref:Uncharacterized protein n=1 Tax=Balaenoptera musculus TaxID=9771 RepID=A0A8C0D076_BALMU